MFRSIKLVSISLISMVIFAGCMAANVKISQPASSVASGIVIKIPRICPPLMPCSNQTVTFARLEGDGIISSDLYQTSTMKSDHYYLLNVEPGTYVAVAATYARELGAGVSGGNISVGFSRAFGENILFSEVLVNKTKTTVAAGEIAVMGEFDFNIEGRMALAPSASQFLKNADSTQAHYAKAIDPEMESRGATSSIKFYRGELKASTVDIEARNKLLESATKHLSDSGWTDQIGNSKK